MFVKYENQIINLTAIVDFNYYKAKIVFYSNNYQDDDPEVFFFKTEENAKEAFDAIWYSLTQKDNALQIRYDKDNLEFIV